MQNIFILFLVSLFFSGFFAGCGSKQRNIFLFPEKEMLTLHKLDFPVVKGVSIQRTQTGNLVTWRPVEAQLYTHDGHLSTLIGYNVYRLARAAVIPRKPLNKKAHATTSMLDLFKSPRTQQSFYLVRALFKINDQTIEGPVSLIVSDI